VEPGAFKTNLIQAASMPEGTITDYDAVRQAARRTLHEALRQGDDPRKVAHLILKVARTRSPLLRYGAGREAYWLPYLKVLLPQRLFDYLVRRGFGLLKDEGEPITPFEAEEHNRIQ
jgi:hypothetical protein